MFSKKNPYFLVAKNILIILVIVSFLILIVKFSVVSSDDQGSEIVSAPDQMEEIFDIQFPSSLFIDLLTNGGYFTSEEISAFSDVANNTKTLFKDVVIQSGRITEYEWNILEKVEAYWSKNIDMITLLIERNYFTFDEMKKMVTEINEPELSLKNIALSTGKINQVEWDAIEKELNSSNDINIDLTIEKPIVLYSGKKDESSTPDDLRLIADSPIVFSISIKNDGTTAINKDENFENTFQISQSEDFSESKNYIAYSSGPIEPGSSTVIISDPIKFKEGSYYIRACADMGSKEIGTVDEVDENNNCGGDITFRVIDRSTSGSSISVDIDQISTNVLPQITVDTSTTNTDTVAVDNNIMIDTNVDIVNSNMEETLDSDLDLNNTDTDNNPSSGGHHNNTNKENDEDETIDETEITSEGNILDFKKDKDTIIIKNTNSKIKNVINTTTKEAGKLVNSDSGKIVAGTIASAGALSGTSLSVSAILSMDAFVMSDFLLGAIRLWGIFLTALGIRKRAKYWGSVYDSVTKRPIDPAYVILKDINGKNVASAITDIDGRYGFLVQKGKYTIEVHKTNYEFPSKKIFNKSIDHIYADLYFGDVIEVSGEGEVISKNIPLDPVNFDWNEFEKNRMNLSKFYSRKNFVLSKVGDILFALGLLITLVNIIFTGSIYNIIILIIYVLLYTLRFVIIKPRSYSSIIDKEHNLPLSFSIVHITDKLSHQVIYRVADKIGRFYCILPNGNYKITIEKKGFQDDYIEIYKNDNYEVRAGKINENFKV